MHPNEGNMIVVPITKSMEIIMSIQVYLISQMNFDYKEMMEIKAFLANPKHQYRASKWGEHDCIAYNRKDRDFYEYQSLSHFMDEH